ncbi:ATP-binding protein [Roseivivax sp. CAU 1761]
MASDTRDTSDLRLREAKHRFANSLTLLKALVQRELRKVEGPEAREALTYIGEAIEIVHTLNHTASREGCGTGLEEQLTEMARTWQRLCNGHIEIAVDVSPDFRTESQTARDILLITQELILNAVKHAFPNGRNGTVRIELTRDATDHAVLVVGDDGVGLSEKVMADGKPHEGRQLISMLARNIGGAVEEAKGVEGGHTVRVRWPSGGLE